MEAELISTSNEESKHRRALRRYKVLDVSVEPQLKFGGADDPEKVKLEFIQAFNWYNSHCDRTKAKSWILAYAKTHLVDKVDVEAVAACAEFALTTGYLARIASRGTKLPVSYSERLLSFIRKMEEIGKKDLNQYKVRLDKLAAGREKAQEKFQLQINAITDDCIMELEHQIDEFIKNKFSSSFDCIKFLKEKKLSKTQYEDISKHFMQSHIQELNKLIDHNDKFLKEAYSNFTKDQQIHLYNFIGSFIDIIRELKVVAPDKAKQQRKARKKKAKTPQQLVKKLQFLTDSPEFGLKSLSPEKIVGATQLWVFNVKYRKLGVYNSADSAGLSVKGSTLKNFDSATSIEKKLRKPQEILPGILEGGKPAIRKSLQTIKCKEQKLTGRINKDTIILRVF